MSPAETPPRAVLCVYSAQQLLPALAALFECRSREGLPVDSPACLLVWCSPDLGVEASRRRLDAVRRLTESLDWLEILELSGRQAAEIEALPTVARRAAALERALPAGEVDQIYYSHDLTADFIARVLMVARPSAARICFGDAWGVVYSNRHFERETFPCLVSMLARRPIALARNVLTRMRRRFVRGGMLLEPQLIVAILPLDPGGDMLARIPHVKVARKTVLEVLGLLRRAAPRPIPEAEPGDVLLLVGSYAESRLCSVQQELELYADALAVHAADGRVLVKPHPSAARAKLESLQSYLGRAGLSIERFKEDLDEFPVELLCENWGANEIVSFSYSSVSLTYLGLSNVVHALTDERVDAFFPASARSWVVHSNALYVAQMQEARRAAQAEAMAEARPPRDAGRPGERGVGLPASLAFDATGSNGRDV